ncbi:MAG: hypothetical protein QNJ41_01085 [Xenococcaceae cyanobacterium MO_188.B32]|nr:hypothetical protein [Xenococcaceae cyanobacterium MO_188.B32]
MYLPPLQPVINKDVYINGDVTIHPSAAIAPGVILQAAPNSRITIGAEVSIGMGTVINACQGEIAIADGATLGAGVLIVGAGAIGSNACIGTATTIFNSSVDAMVVITPGSLIGDISRPYNIQETPNNNFQSSAPQKVSSTAKVSEQNGSQPESKSDDELNSETTEVNSTTPKSTVLDSEVTDTTEVELEPEKNGSEVEKKPNSVVGQVYINQLLLTLFPHSRSSNPNSPQDKLE